MAPGGRLLIKNKRGGPSVNPLVGVIRKAQRDAAYYATLLGLTPSARAALDLKPTTNDQVNRYFTA
jgi:phage terminase small subunit